MGKHIASFKRIFQEVSPRRPSQQPAHVEAIVKLWHSAIDENELVIDSKGYCGNLSLSFIPNQQDLFSSLYERHSSLISLSCSDCEDQRLEKMTMQGA